ncbi:MAG: LuxR C-terminal-related transcriptional regulator [Erythrobacter sp.]
MEEQIRSERDIARLTHREREALRGWLERKSAKQIALDLGVSHHAIEKRLKTARLKLGVASSLEAARLLAEAEGLHAGYQHKGAQRAEVPQGAAVQHGWRRQPRIMGAFAMLFTIAAAIVLSQQAKPHGASPPAAASSAEERIAASTRRTFNLLDEDRSGFLEPPESPIIQFALMDKDETATAVAKVLNAARKGAENEARTAITTSGVKLSGSDSAEQFYREADRDGDGKVSYAEFHQWSAAQLASIGMDLAAASKP